MKAQDIIEIIENMIEKKVSSPYSLGRVDPNHTGGNPKILFDGETRVSVKRYSYLGSYNPTKNDRVLIANIAGTHVVIGKVIS